MKTKKILPIIAIIIAVSVLSTCDIFGTVIGTVGGIPAKMRAFDNQGSTPSRAVAPNSRAVYPTDKVDTASFSSLTSYYTSLSTRQGQFTPTKFVAFYNVVAITKEGYWTGLGYGYFDFTQGLTINIGEVPAGITCSAIVLQLSGNYGSEAIVEFNDSGAKSEQFNTIWNNSRPPTDTSLQIDTLIFGAGVSQVKLYAGTDVPVSSIVPGVDSIDNAIIFGPPGSAKIVFPFEAVNISGSASSVTLSVSFDLTNIIEKYTVSGTTRYVLKNNWWENIYLTASAE